MIVSYIYIYYAKCEYVNNCKMFNFEINFACCVQFATLGADYAQQAKCIEKCIHLVVFLLFERTFYQMLT